VNDAGAVVVGPTGVAVAEPPGRVEVGIVLLPAGIEAPPVGAVVVEIKVVGAVPEGVMMGVPEEQGTVMVVPWVTIVVYEITDGVVLAVTDEAADELPLAEEIMVVVGVQSGRVKVPL
jgi:hypothetical protein